VTIQRGTNGWLGRKALGEGGGRGGRISVCRVCLLASCHDCSTIDIQEKWFNMHAERESGYSGDIQEF